MFVQYSRNRSGDRNIRIISYSVLIFILFFMPSVSLFSQQTNLNSYYRFPVSVGAEYQTWSPFNEYGAAFNIYELSAHVRVPVPPVPLIQPFFTAGMLRFDSQDIDEPLTWDNTHWFAGLGAGFFHRFAKNFEIGGEIAASFSQAWFPNLLPDEGTVGEKFVILEAGARIDLNPSYNFNISVHPSIKYLTSFGPLDDFNGFSFGIGFGGSFRFGKDPDSPQAIIRSIQFSGIDVPPLFAAMQSYYVRNPVGTVTVTNSEKRSLTDVEVSFFQNGYMDSPTPSAKIAELRGGESVDIDLLASFNGDVFTTEGITPLTGEIIVTYFSGTRPVEQRQPVSFDLYDKTSVTWDDDRKVAAFITPADSALRNYASFIRQSCKDATIRQYNGNLQFAIQTFHALSELGMMYQIDPTQPFTEMQENPLTVDSVSLPRNTLQRITGDCDDLTVLFCTMLETIGIETGFITVPGHIYAVFNTQAKTGSYRDIHPDRELCINLKGELWIPIEITMIGTTGFQEAWRKGAEEWNAWNDEPDKRAFYITAEARELYRPVGLKETDLGLQYGNAQRISNAFAEEAAELVNASLAEYIQEAQSDNTKKSWNKLGIACARFVRLREAANAFTRVLNMDPSNIPARVNLANIYFLQKAWEAARDQYLYASNMLMQNGREDSDMMAKLQINLSRTYYSMKAYDQATESLDKAEEIDPGLAKKYSYIASAADDTGSSRASEQPDISADILFLEEAE